MEFWRQQLGVLAGLSFPKGTLSELTIYSAKQKALFLSTGICIKWQNKSKICDYSQFIQIWLSVQLFYFTIISIDNISQTCFHQLLMLHNFHTSLRRLTQDMQGTYVNIYIFEVLQNHRIFNRYISKLNSQATVIALMEAYFVEVLCCSR